MSQYRSLESAGQTTDSKAPKNSRIFIGFGGPQAHGDSLDLFFAVSHVGLERRHNQSKSFLAKAQREL